MNMTVNHKYQILGYKHNTYTMIKTHSYSPKRTGEVMLTNKSITMI